MPELSPEVLTAIAYVVGVLVAILGPRPLNAIFELLNIPGGALRVIGSYVASAVVAVVALGIAGQFSGVELTLDGVIRLLLLVVATAQVVFHRLKDANNL